MIASDLPCVTGFVALAALAFWMVGRAVAPGPNRNSWLFPICT
jgi:hypothetical protein